MNRKFLSFFSKIMQSKCLLINEYLYFAVQSVTKAYQEREHYYTTLLDSLRLSKIDL